MPRRPARPVSCVYSPGVRNSWRSPVNFDSFSITTERAGMLMPRARVSVANTTFTRPAGEGLLHRLLHRRHHPRVVGGEARLEPRQPLVVAEHVEVVVGEAGGLRVGDRADEGPLVRLGEAQPGGQALLDRLVAALAAEHERDGGQHRLRREQLGGLDPARGAQPGAGPAAPAGVAGVAGVEAGGVGVGAELAVGPGDERRQQVQLRRRPARRRGSGARASPGGAPR